MLIKTTLTGTKPLLQHNVQLANPDNIWSKRISAITKKRSKTEDDRRELARVEWQGSLYTHNGRVVVPTANVLKSFLGAGKLSKQGKAIGRSLFPLEIVVPLIYNGPQDIEKLIEHQEFYDQTIVTVGQQKVVRTRPIFTTWAVVVEWELMSDVLDYDEFAKIAKLAGRVEGLGDNRGNGWGRYGVEIAVQKEIKEAA